MVRAGRAILAASVLSVALAGSVFASPSAGVTMTELPTCTFTVHYEWSGFGGRTVRPQVALAGTAFLSVGAPTDGKSGTYSATFTATGGSVWQGVGELLNGHAKPLMHSQVFTAETLETC